MVYRCAYARANNRHPIVAPHGINSGVLFLKFDKMKEFQFERKITNLLDVYMNHLKLPEQDLLNILFSNQTG
jgi:lipopolysaccharide biosynthesis glycosyltransferase